MSSPIFLVYKNENNEFVFELRSKTNECLLKSQTHHIEQGCISTIVSCKLHAPFDKNYQRLKARNGKYYFNLRSKNQHIIGTSQEFDSERTREQLVEAVKVIAIEAKVVNRSSEENIEE